MPPAGIIDTGAIVAIVDADESWHDDCLDALASLQLPLLTTEAVLTELFHLIAARNLSMNQVWKFVLSGALTVRHITDSDLPALHTLMAQYKDRPMDFADATLVHLAGRESLSLILTVDHADFEAYRIGGRKRFTILPARAAK
ncbi:MAG: PIN domain-containing protein [Terriglobales bacterium]